MEQFILKKISFGTYIKVFFLSGLGFGSFGGILSLISGLLGGPVTANIGNTQYSGAMAGVLGLIIFPITFASIFCIFSIFMYPFFTLILKFVKGIKIKAFIEVSSLK